MKKIKSYNLFINENYEEDLIKSSDSEIEKISKIENLMAEIRNSLIKNYEVSNIANNIESLKDKYYFCKSSEEKLDVIEKLKTIKDEIKEDEISIETNNQSNFKKIITKLGFIITLLGALSCNPNTPKIAKIYKQQNHTSNFFK